MASSILLKDILTFLERLAPWELAESWDNVGLMVGNPEQKVKGILVALDPSLAVLDEAIENKTNTILTHHPLIFHPLKSINSSTPLGVFLKKALTHDIAVISCHTNLDVTENGVSDALADRIGLKNTKPLLASTPNSMQGFGKIGRLDTPMNGSDFLQFVAKKLRLSSLPVAGKIPQTVTIAAVCGGSGSDLAETAVQGGAQVYITAEVKHATARWAEENNLCIIDGGHFPTENIIISRLVNHLSDFLTEKNCPAPVLSSQNQDNPLRFYNFLR